MRKYFFIAPFLLLFNPLGALAHEVYVLDAATIARDVAAHSQNPFNAFYTNQGLFFFWGFIAFLTISTIFCISVFHVFEQRISPLLNRLKRFAPLIERITFGLSLIAFAYNAALFGPELPLLSMFGAETGTVAIVLYVTGALITLGLFTRAASVLVALIACAAIPTYGWYMLMYTAYFFVAVTMSIMGSGTYSLDRLLAQKGPLAIERLRKRFEPYEMMLLRIGFGTSVIAAAVYAKFLHTPLALTVISQYHLTTYFPFEPLFIVLGAFIIETLIGLFIMFGIAVRWTSIFFLFWLTLSLLYFGEAAWPHLALFGLNFMLFAHGYDRYSLEGRFLKRGAREPVL